MMVDMFVAIAQRKFGDDFRALGPLPTQQKAMEAGLSFASVNGGHYNPVVKVVVYELVQGAIREETEIDRG